MKTIVTRSSGQTRRLGKAMAEGLDGNETLALYGELGSGKTEFVKGLGLGLGIKGKITSPTFVLLNGYRAKRPGRCFPFYHLDLYRLSSAKDATSLGISEILSATERVAAIEWPEKLKKHLPGDTIVIRFDYGQKENERKIHFSPRRV